ncbi:MAG: alanine racemase [Armatimonadetes bacterium]|nr:alanine racemase [Armatimonadota bacterium]
MSHAWIEVDLSALKDNFRQLSTAFGNCRVIPVVKSDAYGHGANATALALQQVGADTLAVTFVEEAAALREAGYSGRIWLLAPVRGADIQHAVELDLTACITDIQAAQELSDAASQQQKLIEAQIKIDSGMGRLGVRPDEAVELAKALMAQQSLRLVGVYSHCANGASAAAVARQLQLFQRCCAEIEAEGIAIPMRHIAASAASLALPESRLDAVRIGTLLYGQFPAAHLRQTPAGRELNLKQTWAFKARILQIRSMPPGASIGYSSEYQTSRVSRIAVVSAGLAEGLGMQPASLSRAGLKGIVRSLAPKHLYATVRNQKAPIVGRVGMQLCSIDVTDIQEAQIGDEVLLPVRRIASNAALPRVYLSS